MNCIYLCGCQGAKLGNSEGDLELNKGIRVQLHVPLTAQKSHLLRSLLEMMDELYISRTSKYDAEN